jgi:hypothetical protein
MMKSTYHFQFAKLRRTKEAEELSLKPAIMLNEAGERCALPPSVMPDWPIVVAKLHGRPQYPLKESKC